MILKSELYTCQQCQNVWISEREGNTTPQYFCCWGVGSKMPTQEKKKSEGNTSTGCGTYPHIPDEAQMKNHQASYFVSICLIFLFILASSVPCQDVRLQSTTDKCNKNAICVRVNP